MRAAKHRLRERRISRVRDAGVAAPVPRPDRRHGDGRDDVDPEPEPERAGPVVELVPVQERRREEHPGEQGGGEEAEPDRVPSTTCGHLRPEQSGRAVAGAHQHGGHRRFHRPGEPPVRLLRPEVQHDPRRHEDRGDGRGEHTGERQDPIVAQSRSASRGVLRGLRRAARDRGSRGALPSSEERAPVERRSGGSVSPSPTFGASASSVSAAAASSIGIERSSAIAISFARIPSS